MTMTAPRGEHPFVELSEADLAKLAEINAWALAELDELSADEILGEMAAGSRVVLSGDFTQCRRGRGGLLGAGPAVQRGCRMDD